ncbi:MAG: hypothetical protein NTV68_14335 [Methanomicrobiales archaeon]|nr:hypothetical protein [Methanomicrobiales archaeon]
MISDLYGDYYRFQKDWKLIRIVDWTKVIISVILGGIGIGLIIAPVFMVLLHFWTVAFALSVATINALLGLILVGTGKLIFDRIEDHQILAFVYYFGTSVSLIIYLFITVLFYTRFTYIIAA